MPIDHTAYPHILDAVLAHSDLATLLAFRATSRGLLSRVNATLLAHAALRPWPGDGSDAFVLTTPTAPARRLPFVPSAVRILDLVCDRAVPPGLAGQLSLHTLRRTGGAWAHPPPPAETTVDYVPCYGSKERVRLVLGTARAIVHLKYVHASVPTFDVRVEAALRHLVVVLWPPEAERVMDPVGAAAALVAALARLGQPLELTVVGFERFSRDGGVVATGLESGGARSSLLGVRMMTLDEWWGEIGARKDVEGVWID
ncbi:hypothetical protein Q8F55_000060 [Vanrija albida]|uniref:F-box domain-containing protein n=1 Tax=Vanrija albida TaxID=181172 RepID=A0ABR3QC63_9TREE